MLTSDICAIVVQELEEIARVYGREALTTIMSQSDVKQFFGVASLDTARLVSAMLGDQEVCSESFGMGQNVGDIPSLSIGRARIPLLTAEQIRRLPEDEQIIFVKNLPPIRAMKVGYQEVEPWRDQVAPNPLHGGKAFLGEIKMCLVQGRAKVTRAGRRKPERQARPMVRPVLAALTGLIPGMPMLLLAGAILTVITYGWPHLLIEYTHSGSWCRYIGPPIVTQPFETHGNGHCKLIVWTKSRSPVK